MSGSLLRRAARVPARAMALVVLIGFWLREMVVANAIVAWEVATPRRGIAPAIVRVSVRSRSTLELTALSGMLTITPGTLVIHVDQECGLMYVHGLHVHDVDRFRSRIARLEDRLLAVTR